MDQQNAGNGRIITIAIFSLIVAAIIIAIMMNQNTEKKEEINVNPVQVVEEKDLKNKESK